MNTVCAKIMTVTQTIQQTVDTGISTKVLSVSQLEVSITGVKRLVDINFSVAAGEVLSIVGANGAGKTTLLNAITGDAWLDAGGIMFAGQHEPLRSPQINGHTAKNLAKQIAVLPQFSLLNFPFTVEEVIALGRSPHSSGVRVDNEIVLAVGKLMDIEALFGRSYTHLSGGEKQRVQIARVMAQIWPYDEPRSSMPRLLLLDEPMTALDLGHQQQVLKAVREFARRGVAVIMVMHDINLAARYADTMLALSSAKILAYGQPEDVVQPQFMNPLFNIESEVIKHKESGCPVLLIR